MKKWTPHEGINQLADSFGKRARTYYDNFVLGISHNSRSILQLGQQIALKELSSRIDIVTLEADKEGAISVINKDDNTADCNALLEDNLTYRKTTTDVMEIHI